MTYQPSAISGDLNTLPKLPAWVTSGRGEALETMAFLSGASFAMLDVLLQQTGDAVPKTLLANTLALKAAVATSKLEGRMATEADIRDAYHLTPLDEEGVRHWGPDGDVLDYWRNAARLRLGNTDWVGTATDHINDRFSDAAETWLATAVDRSRSKGALAAATGIMHDVLEADDRAERIACLLSDVVLARYFGWDRTLPITALHLTKSNLRDLREGTGAVDVHRAITQSAQTTYRLAADLAVRAEALRTIAPKLRTRGSEDAVALFLREDAVAPSGMLSPMIRGTSSQMTARAARRFCDRLVELGVARELTGRPTFRLYGIAP